MAGTDGYPLGKRLSGRYSGTFASKTLQERLPKVLTQIIDSLHRYQPTAQKHHGEAGTQAVKNVLNKLSEFRYRMQTDKAMEPILSGEDIKEWQTVFEIYRNKRGGDPRWMQVSWLFFECYMYRKVMELVKTEPCISTWDPFQENKERSYVESMKDMKVVGTQLLEWIDKGANERKVARRNMFDNFLLLSLWGNKMDLSMAATLDTYDMSQVLHLSQQSTYVLADNSQQLWDILCTPKEDGEEKREVAIVLDNSGFELISDLCFAEWILSDGKADKVTLYCKSMPWFISDVTQKDFNWTVTQLKDSADPILKRLGQIWTERLSNGSLVLVVHPFWTTCYEYAAMKQVAPDLYDSLSRAIVVVFKGDLNYRKLIGDRNWSYSKEFSDALQGFHPTNIVALRTLKADLVTGLSLGVADRAKNESKDWMITGQYAVIQVYKSD